MRLIDADEYDRELQIEQMKREEGSWGQRFFEASRIDLANRPTVPAVSLDKLCEWLAKNAWHLDCSNCDGEYCDCPQWHDDSGGSPEFWKTKLTKWMEKQDAQ
jgi:hypothetical protein